jgi:hypothetical protein
MRRGIGTYLATAAVLAAAVMFAPPAYADTCTERQQVCFAFCQRTEDNSAPCRAVCRGYLDECVSTGCWESRVSAKRCGFERK